MMREKNPWTPVVFRTGFKKPIPQISGGSLEGEAFGFGVQPGLRHAEFDGEFQSAGGGFNQGLLFG
jgi:hypothetical protein